tara:strand:- start:147558 stop:147704 length:147 start_codon:yes stop_codon:yes gene_type:complete
MWIPSDNETRGNKPTYHFINILGKKERPVLSIHEHLEIRCNEFVHYVQ